MAEVTQRLVLPLIQSGQAQKEITHNEALHRLDWLVHLAVQSRGTLAPPPSPAEGATWIVPAGASGAWAGHASELAAWSGGDWSYSSPSEGMFCWIADEAIVAVFGGGAWQADFFPVSGLKIGASQIFGSARADVAAPSGGAVVDFEARAAFNSLCTYLRSQGILGTP